MHFESIPELSPIPLLSSAGATRVRTVARQQVERCAEELEAIFAFFDSGELKGVLECEVAALDFDANQTRLRAKAEVIAHGMRMAHLNVRAIADACRGFADLSDAGRTVLAVLPVARGGLEAAVSFTWLMDPKPNRHQRLVRMAAALMHENDMAEPLSGFLLDDSVRAQQEKERQNLENTLRAADISWTTERGVTSFFSPTSRKPVTGRLNMTSLLSTDRELIGAWRLASGAAHSRPWLIGGELATHPEAAHGPHMVAATCLIRSCAMVSAVARETLDVTCQTPIFFNNAVRAVHYSLVDSAGL